MTPTLPAPVRAPDLLQLLPALGDASMPTAAVLPLAVLALWAVVMRTAVRDQGLARCWPLVPAALLAGAAVAALAWWLLPPGPAPGLAEAGTAWSAAWRARAAAAFGLAAAAFGWPLLVLRQGRRRPSRAGGRSGLAGGPGLPEGLGTAQPPQRP